MCNDKKLFNELKSLETPQVTLSDGRALQATTKRYCYHGDVSKHSQEPHQKQPVQKKITVIRVKLRYVRECVDIRRNTRITYKMYVCVCSTYVCVQ